MPDNQDKPTTPPAAQPATPKPGAAAPQGAGPAPQPAPELSAEELDQLAGAGPRNSHFS